MVIGQHYLNYSSGGDALATPYADYDDVTGIRAQQIAAAAAEGGVYVDFYTYLKARIQAGTDTQGSFTWHIADSNVHLSEYGHQLLADLLATTIQNQQGWFAAISS